MVLIPLMQTLVLNFSVIMLGLCGLTLKYTFYYWLPRPLKTAYEYAKNRIFWNFPLRVLIQQYMMVTMSIFLNFRFRGNEELEDKINRFAAGTMLVFYSILFPLVVTFVLYKYYYKWQLPEFARMFDSLTVALYVHSGMSSIMYGLSMIRQFIIVFIAVRFDFSLLQFTVALYLQEIYTIYLLDTKPMKEPWRNYVEYFNEIMLFTQVILMCTLTDFVPSPWVRYNITGWLMIYIMYIQFTMNAILLVYQMLSSLRIAYFKARFAYYQRKFLAKYPNRGSRED